MKKREKKGIKPTHFRAPLHPDSRIFGALCGSTKDHPSSPNIGKTNCPNCLSKHSKLMAIQQRTDQINQQAMSRP